jgi:hypothetical protein
VLYPYSRIKGTHINAVAHYVRQLVEIDFLPGFIPLTSSFFRAPIAFFVQLLAYVGHYPKDWLPSSFF